MNAEMKQRLEKFEHPLQTSLAGYARIAPSDFVKVLEIYYGSDWRSKTPSSVLTCGNCKLNELRKIANEYFRDEG